MSDEQTALGAALTPEQQLRQLIDEDRQKRATGFQEWVAEGRKKFRCDLEAVYSWSSRTGPQTTIQVVVLE